MVTRSKDELSGIFVNIKDGAILEKAKRGCPIGTTVTVRNLFRNVPARLKFLKSTATENGHISNLVAQYSLAFPEVRFTLLIDGRTAFRSTGSGNLREVLGAVYGLDVARAMLLIEAKEEADPLLPAVTGFISPIMLTRASRSYMSFFVNRRWVQNRMLTYALEEAYQGLLMVGRHPLAVINISLMPQELDVNVHPTKNEVKFRNERDIFSAVQRAVRATLTAQAPMPALDTLVGPPQPVSASQAERLPAFTARPEEAVTRTPIATTPPSAEPVAKSLPILRVVGQMANTYIIAEGPDGMYLIDQHAAHERVLFEKIRNERSRRAPEVQGLLEPVPVELTVRQQEVLDMQAEALSEYGFGIEHFGERTYLVRSVPAVLRGQNVTQSLVEVLDFLAEGEKGDRREDIAASLACHGAVRAGQALSHEEMRDLIRQLEQASQPRTCPHGRPTMIHLSSLQLEKGFGRR